MLGEAPNGEEAIERIRELRPDLVLLDRHSADAEPRLSRLEVPARMFAPLSVAITKEGARNTVNKNSLPS